MVSRHYSSKGNFLDYGIGRAWMFNVTPELLGGTTPKVHYATHRLEFSETKNNFPVAGYGNVTAYTTPNENNFIFQHSNGWWIVKREDNINEVFNSEGLLIRRTFSKHLVTINGTSLSSQGPYHQYHYNAAGQLSSIQHSNGDVISFAWTGDKITSITDMANRTYLYEYTNNTTSGLHQK